MIMDMNSKELHRFELLACLDVQLMSGAEPLEARLRSIKDGWRDYKMILSRIGSLVSRIYETMPDKSIRHMQQLTRHGEAIVRLKPAGGAGYFQPVDVNDLRILINLAIEAECFGCSKGKPGIRGCKLRKTLMTVAPPTDVSLGECPYRYVVDNAPLGEYI